MAHKSNIPAALPEAVVVTPEEIYNAYKAGDFSLICVLGPTASGKTAYAVRLARALNRLAAKDCPAPVADASSAFCQLTSAEGFLQTGGAEIISADSRQVYRGMDIGTGKDLSEYGEIPYHLIDIQPAGAKYNVHQFTLDFKAAYEDIRGRGGIPILCGGTGLYINAVVAAYDFESRRPLSEARQEQGLKTFFIGTLVSREVRCEKIDRRLDARLKEGMVEEIRSLLDGTSPGCPIGPDGVRIPVPAETLLAYGLEYKFVTQYILGELPYDEMRRLLAIAIHQFAKRQMTWFRGMERAGVHIHWVEP